MKDIIDAIFIGDNNCMMFQYARSLHDRGFNILYFVIYDNNQTLHRPENHYHDISYPYPKWIVEDIQQSKMFVSLFPLFKARQINKLHSKVVFLSGQYIALSPFLNSRQKIIIPHGTDATVTFDNKAIKEMYTNITKKFIPNFLLKIFIKKIYSNMKKGFESSNLLVYYPYGLTSSTDNVLKQSREIGLKIIHRLDMSPDIFKQHLLNYEKKSRNSDFLIISPVRFFFTNKTVSYAPDFYKGNDIIIKGLSKFKKYNNKFKCIFFDKGEDVQEAKKLIEHYGLSDNIIWHKEISMVELLSLYKKSDVCIEQVGKHWISGVGMISLFLGIPLIANSSNLIKSKFWPDDAPVFNCDDSAKICNSLINVYNGQIPSEQELKEFANHYCSTERVAELLVNYINKEESEK